MLHRHVATGIEYKPGSNFARFFRERWPVKLDWSGTLNDHELIAGLSGAGKSSLALLKMIQGYYDGRCELLIDTLYQTFRDTLHMCIHLGIPPEDVFIFDLTRPTLSRPRIHFLGAELGMEIVRREGLVSTIRNVPQWRTSIGERMVDILYHLFKTLQMANMPITVANHFLINHHSRFEIFGECGDESEELDELEEYWEHIFSMRDAKNIIESTRNKLSILINHDYIRPFISSTHSNIDFGAMMNRPCICLFNISRRFFKDDTRGILAALLFYWLYTVLMERENEKSPHPVDLYLEEFHEYAIPELYLPMITGSRKFGAGLKIITQSLGAFHRTEIELLMGTVGSISAFALSDADAKFLQDNMFLYTGKIPKKVKRDIFGVYEIEERYSVGDERLHTHNEITEQKLKEFVLRIRGEKANKVYFATTADVPQVEMSEKEEVAYRRASAKAWNLI